MNRLASETSPYLRQHADNPVDWYPWGDEAFERARTEDRPLFVSVGYSACHWCHVMAHESFEDESVAVVLNDRFVPVKVDREERPDVDAIYMEAVQALTAHGGWPMSVFVTPDGRPFFGGTYFPPDDRHGMPSFRRVLEAVDDAWRNRREEIERQADTLVDAVERRMRLPQAPATDLTLQAEPARESRRLLDGAVAALVERYDPEWGGFGPAPKFPQSGLVELCFRHHRVSGDEASLAMATGTLAAMAAGGIYDHLGGGFARYSTDRTWTVPHFEKMLYDQAGLVRAYLHAWQVTGQVAWRQVVEETIAYVLRDLTVPGGGLASAEDADSEGEEGRFYVWRPEEVDAVVGSERAEATCDWYGVTAQGNFEGSNILRRPVGAPLERPTEIERAREDMFAARTRRVRPGRDDKVLLEWNAMFGSALAEAAGATGRTDWATAALELAEFLFGQLRGPGGRWMRSWQDGKVRHLAYAGDYAWVVDFFTRVAELTGRQVWLERATETARAMLELFGPGVPLFTTGVDAPALVVRPVEMLDGAVPSATSVAAGALARLGALAGDPGITASGEALMAVLVAVAGEHPLAAANAVAASALGGGGVTEVVVTGERPDLLEVARTRYEPTAVLAWGERGASALWEGRDDDLAYVCRHFACRAPAATPSELRARLDDELASDRESEAVSHVVGSRGMRL